MSDPRWKRVKQIAGEALERVPAEREAWLDEACRGDPQLRREVESLLAYDAESFLEQESLPTLGAPDRPPGALATGTCLGPYEIREPLGSGGMGEVYRAHDSRLERDVAVKVVHARSFSDPAARGRLLREARSAARLNHPHICAVYDVGEDEGQVFIAMELVEGEPLLRRLSNGPLPTGEAIRYGVHLAGALAHAHEQGVVHRDLKSGNVVVTSDGRAKVLDFGLAKRIRDEAGEEAGSLLTVTQPGAVMGTLVYMAPEQLRGEPADARSDLWAMGIVLYEMVVGRRPFEGTTGFQVTSAILSHPPRPLPSKVPLALRAVIERCLEKDPTRRYQRAAELRADLEAIEAGEGASWKTGLYLFRQRRWLAASLGLALPALLAVGLDIGGVRDRLFPGAGGPRIESLVVLPFTNLSGDPEQEFVADGMTEALIAELSTLESLGVVSRTSAMQYKRVDKPLREIVSELNVDGVIEGGVLREGDQVRATISLIDGRTERSLWARSFERESTGILALHREMVRAIAEEVQLTLSPQEEALLAGGRPVDPEAYEAYLKGRMHWYKQTPMDVDRALQYFQLALEKDPDFALAHLGMGYVWTYYASVGLIPPGETGVQVVEALRKAREIDPTLAETYEVEADYKFYYDWDWEGAERDYARAIEMKPNSADMRLFYWHFLAAMDRPEEARAQIERCLELDPFNSYVQMDYGIFLLTTRRFDDAVDQFHEVLRTEMDFGPAHLGLWQAYHHQGMHAEALEAAKSYFTKWGDEEMVGVLEAGIAEGGYAEAMRRAAREKVERSDTRYVLATEVAQLFAYAGDEQGTLEWLEKAYRERETGLVKLQVDPDWDLVRHHPRFHDLLRRMDFPPV